MDDETEGPWNVVVYALMALGFATPIVAGLVAFLVWWF